MKRAILALAAIGLSACVDHPLAFPANDMAQTQGNITIDMKMYGMGSGPVTFHMPDGETVVGRYSVLYGGSIGFGSVYAAAYGSGAYANGSGFSTFSSLSRTSPAIADAAGPRTTIHCEVMLATLTGHGNGACKTLAGALYRVQF